MAVLQPSDDAREAYESTLAAREAMERTRAAAEVVALELEDALDRNHFADKIKALMYGRTV